MAEADPKENNSKSGGQRWGGAVRWERAPPFKALQATVGILSFILSGMESF